MRRLISLRSCVAFAMAILKHAEPAQNAAPD
jgi:hypothetical protein